MKLALCALESKNWTTVIAQSQSHLSGSSILHKLWKIPLFSVYS